LGYHTSCFPRTYPVFTSQIFRLRGLFRDFRTVRDLDYLLFVTASSYFDGTLTTKWNDVEHSIQFLVRKGVLINEIKFFHQLKNLLKITKIRLTEEEVQRLASKPAVGQVF
jgi:hypothetical protein